MQREIDFTSVLFLALGDMGPSAMSMGRGGDPCTLVKFLVQVTEPPFPPEGDSLLWVKDHGGWRCFILECFEVPHAGKNKVIKLYILPN